MEKHYSSTLNILFSPHKFNIRNIAVRFVLLMILSTNYQFVMEFLESGFSSLVKSFPY